MILRNIFYDIDRGKREKFPKCCVAFYSLLWGRLSDFSQTSPTALKLWLKTIGNPYHRMINSDRIDWGRIPCPRCVLRDKFGLP